MNKYDDTIPRAEREAQQRRDALTQQAIDLDARMTVIEQREPLMFDAESAHGIAALYAVGILEQEFLARPTAWSVADQALQVEYAIEALNQYLLQLREPDCPQCGAGLTPQTLDPLGRSTWCPTCQQPRG